MCPKFWQGWEAMNLEICWWGRNRGIFYLTALPWCLLFFHQHIHKGFIGCQLWANNDSTGMVPALMEQILANKALIVFFLGKCIKRNRHCDMSTGLVAETNSIQIGSPAGDLQLRSEGWEGMVNHTMWGKSTVKFQWEGLKVGKILHGWSTVSQSKRKRWYWRNEQELSYTGCGQLWGDFILYIVTKSWLLWRKWIKATPQGRQRVKWGRPRRLQARSGLELW